MSLLEDEFERYSRQIVLSHIGYDGQIALKKARVCIIGLGGLGSHAAPQLAAMGVGFMRIVDQDIVDLTNLHRQTLYSTEDVGYPKVEAAAKRLRRLNPQINVEPLPIVVNHWTVEDIVKDVDVVLDGLDSVETRYAVNRACVKHRVPYIHGGAIETLGSASTILPRRTPCLACIYPSLKDEDLPKCAVVGVHPSVVSLIASIQVSEAVNVILAKKPSLAGALFIFDLSDATFDKILVRRNRSCPVCSRASVAVAVAPIHRFITEVCGREGGKRVYVVSPREKQNLNIDLLQEGLKKLGVTVNARGELGISFTYDKDMKLTVFYTGTGVITTSLPPERASEALRQILESQLNVDWRSFSGQDSPGKGE